MGMIIGKIVFVGILLKVKPYIRPDHKKLRNMVEVVTLLTMISMLFMNFFGLDGVFYYSTILLVIGMQGGDFFYIIYSQKSLIQNYYRNFCKKIKKKKPIQLDKETLFKKELKKRKGPNRYMIPLKMKKPASQEGIRELPRNNFIK
jgi:hypothetical protein